MHDSFTDKTVVRDTMSVSAHKAENNSLNLLWLRMGTTGEGQPPDLQTDENGNISIFVFLTLGNKIKIHLEYQQIWYGA